MMVICKYGAVEINVGDSWPDPDEGEWTIKEIAGRDGCEGLFQDNSPLVIIFNPRQPDLSSHRAHRIVVRPGLVCHVLDELNVRSVICGQWGAMHGERAAAFLYEHRNGLFNDHLAEYVAQGDIALDVFVDHDLEIEGISREIVRTTQNARKKAGLAVQDRITLQIVTESPLLKETLEMLGHYVAREVLATFGVVTDGTTIHAKIETVSAGKQDLEIRFIIAK